MSYYVIGIGGTGAKCVEAMVHLCAAGLLPDRLPLYALFVDADTANGTLTRARSLLSNYNRCQRLQIGNIELFKTPLRSSYSGAAAESDDVWSPIENESPRLDAFFNYTVLRSTEETKPLAHLFDVLYSEDEKTVSLEKGFRGHPAIGAAVMSATIDTEKVEPWRSVKNWVAQDQAQQGAKVMLFGSIFGGTGACGVPTLARLLSDELGKDQNGNKYEKFKLAGVLMLPYFSFRKPEGTELRADSEDFLLSTQAALKYYHERDNLDIFNAVYLLGETKWKEMRVSSLGGKEQRNDPHTLEMYAGLAAAHFFHADGVDGYGMTARRVETMTGWHDLPWHDAGLRNKIEHLARFCFAYLAAYYPALENIEKGVGTNIPWYVDFFQRRGISLKDQNVKAALNNVKDYSESFLRWLANIQHSASGGNLINYNAFAEVVGNEIQLRPADLFRREEFGRLLLPESKAGRHEMDALWSRMSSAKVSDPNADGVGRFIHALYRECGSFINR